MPFVATFKDLEIITLSEVRHRKTNIVWYHLHVQSEKAELIETENKMVLARGFEMVEIRDNVG